MNGAGLFFLLLLILVIIPVAGWIGFTYYRAHRAGLPPPPLASYNPFNRTPASNYPIAPRSSGVLGWFQDKYHSLRNSRSAGGAYEGGRNGGNRFGPLDPDGAWDTRVGTEADAYGPVGDYEEQELGLHPPAPGAYGGSGYGAPAPTLPAYGSDDMGRGRSRSRDDTAYIGGNQQGLDQRYNEAMGHDDPFGDGAERSNLRAVSPRPAESDAKGHSKKASGGTTQDESPTERKSMFREQM
ncbi:hypothetical protein MMC19_004116 [Ptychographa xylographoides]|nr:hypothetical protein [Ptychographa xylographoides]